MTARTVFEVFCVDLCDLTCSRSDHRRATQSSHSAINVSLAPVVVATATGEAECIGCVECEVPLKIFPRNVPPDFDKIKK